MKNYIVNYIDINGLKAKANVLAANERDAMVNYWLDNKSCLFPVNVHESM